MKTILALGASSSQASINKKLARYAASQLDGYDLCLPDLNTYVLPLFSVDLEAEIGIPQAARAVKTLIRDADGIIISLAEHNGSYSAVFKNLLDWISRIEKSTWLDKPMFLMATSPGKRGGQLVLEAALKRFPHMDGKVAASFSLPSFEQNFSVETGISNPQLKAEFNLQLKYFKQAVPA